MDESSKVTMCAVGDIQLHGSYHEAAQEGKAATLFDDFAELVRGTDLTVGNLETVLTDGGSPREDKLCLAGAPVFASALRGAGFQLLALANNHVLDYGIDGLSDTRRFLKEAGLTSIGAGTDLASAVRPAVVERNGVRLGFLAACHESTRPSAVATENQAGVAPLRASILLPAIEALSSKVDHVILLLHWGLEYSHMPTPEQVEFAHVAIDRGASVILGAHSHSLQGIEHYRRGIIAYSLANFTDAPVDWLGPKRHYRCDMQEVDRESILLKLSFTKNRVELQEAIPLWLDDLGRPTQARGERAEKILTALTTYSEKLTRGDLKRYWQETVIGSRVSAPLASWWRDGSLWDKIRNFRPGQLVTAWLLLKTWMQLRLSRSESRWELFNSRNDTRPMPSAERGKEQD